MKKIRLFPLLMTLAWLMSACSGKIAQRLQHSNTASTSMEAKTSELIVRHLDTTLSIPESRATISSHLLKDSIGNIYLPEVSFQQQQAIITAQVKNGKLTAHCHCIGLEHRVKLQETIIRDLTLKSKAKQKERVVYREKTKQAPVPLLTRLSSKFGWICLLAIFLLIAWYWLKRRLNLVANPLKKKEP